MSASLHDLALVAPSRLTRWAILAIVGVACSSSLLWLQWSLDGRLQEMEQAQPSARPLHTAPPPTPAAPPLSPGAAESIRTELALLNRDWSTLLGALVPRAGVRLLSLDVNPASGAVRIVAEADDREAVTAFAQGLEATAPLAQVRLLRIEQQVAGLTFEVDAQWQ
ncbi:hypothetical protein [Stenotrophomonas sp. JAG2]|uniref:hypothetical protein n=1 Tax=Stenotrophomonas sp. JAG2 TaxID=3229243 RepID=UPI0034E2D9D1